MSCWAIPDTIHNGVTSSAQLHLCTCYRARDGLRSNHSIRRSKDSSMEALGGQYTKATSQSRKRCECFLKVFFSLPFSYVVVSGAIGSCSVLFAKSLSNLLRLAMSSTYELHSWFTYSMLLLFLSTSGFWMARLNEGLSFFDVILIIPMFQIAWTFFSICTGFVYFQEYQEQVFDALRTTMFILGMLYVFAGISLLAPDEPRGIDAKDNSSLMSVTSSTIESTSWPISMHHGFGLL